VCLTALNTTVVFLKPSLDISFEAGMREASKLASGISDVLVGIVPLAPVRVTGKTEPSISYNSVALKWFVPCPRPISRIDRFLTVFDASVWITMLIVFVLTLALFWISANYPDRMVQIDSKIFKQYQNICTIRGVYLLVYPFRRCLDLGN